MNSASLVFASSPPPDPARHPPVLRRPMPVHQGPAGPPPWPPPLRRAESGAASSPAEASLHPSLPLPRSPRLQAASRRPPTPPRGATPEPPREAEVNSASLVFASSPPPDQTSIPRFCDRRQGRRRFGRGAASLGPVTNLADPRRRRCAAPRRRSSRNPSAGGWPSLSIPTTLHVERPAGPRPDRHPPVLRWPMPVHQGPAAPRPSSAGCAGGPATVVATCSPRARLAEDRAGGEKRPDDPSNRQRAGGWWLASAGAGAVRDSARRPWSTYNYAWLWRPRGPWFAGGSAAGWQHPERGRAAANAGGPTSRRGAERRRGR